MKRKVSAEWYVSLKNALWEASPSSMKSPEYVRGLLTGVVKTVMAVEGLTLDETIDYLKGFLPYKVYEESVPEEWRGVFGRITELI